MTEADARMRVCPLLLGQVVAVTPHISDVYAHSDVYLCRGSDCMMWRTAPDTTGPVDGLPFPARVRNCLKAEGIDTIEQLRALSSYELLKIPNFSITSLHVVETALRSEGDGSSGYCGLAGKP